MAGNARRDDYLDERHKFKAGNPGGGREPVPAWLRGHTDELLRLQLQAALTGRIPLAPAGDDDDPEVTDDGTPIPPSKTQIVPAKTRMAAAEALINRVHGRAALVEELPPGAEHNGKLATLYAIKGGEIPPKV